ncbi:MAG: hypothetical protein K2K96_01655 [Lachnospiraceae bacterium]|nr:hypothetical protein [Lachnospiraceae bacterium]
MLAKLKSAYDKLMRKEGKIYRVMMMVSCSIFLFMAHTNVVLAAESTNYGKKAGEWVLENLFWFGLVALAIALFKCLLSRAWVPAIITGVAGAIILYFMQDPEKLADIGEKIATTVFG